MLVWGERADKSMVRAGCDRAYVEAQFTLSAEIQLAIQPLLTEEGLEGDEDDIIVIGREIRANGRSLGDASTAFPSTPNCYKRSATIWLIFTARIAPEPAQTQIPSAVARRLCTTG